MNTDNLHGEELFAFLRTNKSKLIQTKKDSIKYSDALVSTVTISDREHKDTSTKASGDTPPSEPASKDTLKVTIVANTANVVDSHMDMLTDKAYTESIKIRGVNIPHILDHNQSAVGHIGDVTKVYTKVMTLKDLGYNAEGSTTALLMDSTVRKDYNPDAFKFYANGKINQHSVGLTYQDISLAMNSSHESDKEAKTLWDKYYPKVVNKDIVDKRGFFYVVPKVDIRENSAVLFGANPLTPTLSVKSDEIDSPLGNVPSPVIQPIGNTMTLEEAQGKIISLTEELAKVKAESAVAKLEATMNEKNRGLNILKAQATFGSEARLQKAAVSFIEKGLDVETAITSFEVIKEALQTANHVDTSGTQQASTTRGDTEGKEGFLNVLDKALEVKNFNPLAGIK
jgi:hypothetical protein